MRSIQSILSGRVSSIRKRVVKSNPRTRRTATGNASHPGFADLSAKLAKGSPIPKGTATYAFDAGDFAFAATAYDWLVVAGPRATFAGSGTVNGAGSYDFLVSIVTGFTVGYPFVMAWYWMSGGILHRIIRGRHEPLPGQPPDPNPICWLHSDEYRQRRSCRPDS